MPIEVITTKDIYNVQLDVNKVEMRGNRKYFDAGKLGWLMLLEDRDGYYFWYTGIMPKIRLLLK